MFKTNVEQSFEHWHHFYAVDLFFTITLTIFDVHFRSRFLESCMCKEVSSQPISKREITHML